jgi:radical SAM superfamily enzyme YgiQ (UPF0313 family)
MLTLINTNRMQPPIAPLGLDYIAGSVESAGTKVDIVDLCWAEEPEVTLRQYFSSHQPQLVGISFRNSDDCFWPSAQWFVGQLAETVRMIRGLTDSAIVLGGVGFSLAGGRLVEYTGADFGVRGDGEQATIALLEQLDGGRCFGRVPGLIWPRDGQLHCNRPAWSEPLSVATGRSHIDNARYFKFGGQIGVETKRGCDRCCIYCADPVAKGTVIRQRRPAEVADEIEVLERQGVDVLHICDGEFNLPRDHAIAVCRELVRRSLGDRVRWYAYLAVLPFDAELADLMRRAGCVGINFTGDSGCPSMLKTYGHQHTPADLAMAVRFCCENNIAVMIDLLLGGPGETVETLTETIEFMKQINPDCVGTALGIRIYDNTPMAKMIKAQKHTESGICRKYDGPIDFFKPTFYISPALGARPGRVVRDIIGGDKRFFEPEDETTTGTDHNYNDNKILIDAIAAGGRGAYWHIMRRLRNTNDRTGAGDK